jgi:hypothetical protein
LELKQEVEQKAVRCFERTQGSKERGENHSTTARSLKDYTTFLQESKSQRGKSELRKQQIV